MSQGDRPTIQTLESLRKHLGAAVQLELAVIPPYLCGLYTLKPETNTAASQVIRSVVAEEMLHMVLAANTLNAVGGQPAIAGPHLTPRYPARLPGNTGDFLVHLYPFSRRAVDLYLKIEHPSSPHHPESPSDGRNLAATPLRVMQLPEAYSSIGEFYDAIIKGLHYLVTIHGEPAVFSGPPNLQVSAEYYYAGGGTATHVHDLATALAALTEIVDQGEGETHNMFDQDGDLAHYFRFNELKYNRAYRPGDVLPGEPTGEELDVDFAAVYPMLRDPRVEEYGTGELRQATDAFNRTYSELLRQIQRAFRGEPELLQPAVGTMFELKYAAQALINNPLPGHHGHHAGPTFEYVP